MRRFWSWIIGVFVAAFGIFAFIGRRTRSKAGEQIEENESRRRVLIERSREIGKQDEEKAEQIAVIGREIDQRTADIKAASPEEIERRFAARVRDFRRARDQGTSESDDP